jgi:hypothetical protein
MPTLMTHNCHAVNAVVARGYLKHPQIDLPVFVIKSDNSTRKFGLRVIADVMFGFLLLQEHMREYRSFVWPQLDMKVL